MMRTDLKWARRDWLAVAGLSALYLRANGQPPTGDAVSADRIREAWLNLLGPFPGERVALEANTVKVREKSGVTFHHVRFRGEADDFVTAWLLVPEKRKNSSRSTGILCIHPTTSGAGKDLVAGLSGRERNEPLDPKLLSRAYGLELARRGHVVLCIDLLTDGERVSAGLGPYDSRAFYQKHPGWSMVGKNTWDAMRAVDYLLTRPEIDPGRIACLGHSLGGHSSLFAAAFDSRIKVTIANGGVLDWMRPKDHWARPGGFEPVPGAGQKPTPGVGRYTYIKGFAPYFKDLKKVPPVDFDDLMLLIAPRPLLVMESEKEFADYGFPAKASRVVAAYQPNRPKPGQDDLTPFQTRSYPGPHDFPNEVRAFAWRWLENWL